MKSYLTKREKEVYELIKVGLTDKQISEKLSISLATAKNHVFKILKKHGISSRQTIIAWYEHTRKEEYER